MFKDKNLVKYYKKFGLLLMIGMLADILVDYVQLYIPQFLGEVVEIVGSNPAAVMEDISGIIKSILIMAVALVSGSMALHALHDPVRFDDDRSVTAARYVPES